MTEPATSPRPRRRRAVLAAVAVAVVLLLGYAVARSGDDGGGGDGGQQSREEPAGDATVRTAPAEDGTAPEAPDLSEELATAVSDDGLLELDLNAVHQDGDQVTVWATITNLSDEGHGLGAGGRMADPSLGVVGQSGRTDVSGAYLIDWAAARAYYPMGIDDETCLCSTVPASLEPGAEITVFAVYNGIGDLEEATFVVPGFLPIDGLSAP